MKKRNAKIISTGYYAPETVLPNSYFDELLGEEVSTWLEANLSIRERRWCSENESVSDLCVKAAERTIADTGVDAADIDLIVVATDTPEYISPSTSAVVQYRLGALNAGAFDINSACAGFVTALDLGAKYIQADEKFNNVLLIGAYAMSKYLDLKDKKTVSIYADGAGAVLMQPSDGNSGWLGSKLRTEGKYHDWMGVYAGGTKYPLNVNKHEYTRQILEIKKKFPKEENTGMWTKVIVDLVNDIGSKVKDIDLIIFTQININSIRETMNNLGLSMNKTHTIMDRFGYTGSASLPMALAEANERGKVRRGDLVIFIGTGAGVTYAATAFRW